MFFVLFFGIFDMVLSINLENLPILLLFCFVIFGCAQFFSFLSFSNMTHNTRPKHWTIFDYIKLWVTPTQRTNSRMLYWKCIDSCVWAVNCLLKNNNNELAERLPWTPSLCLPCRVAVVHLWAYAGCQLFIYSAFHFFYSYSFAMFLWLCSSSFYFRWQNVPILVWHV